MCLLFLCFLYEILEIGNDLVEALQDLLAFGVAVAGVHQLGDAFPVEADIMPIGHHAIGEGDCDVVPFLKRDKGV